MIIPHTFLPNFRLCGLILASICAALPISAQNRLDHVDGHYVGILDFFNTQPADLKHLVRHPQPAQNGLNGPHGDGWIGDDAIKVRGLMKGAQLTVDWWTLFGDPVTAYVFTWQSTGRYEIIYTDPEKGRVVQTVSREKFAKFPVLQKRFDSLAPLRGDFEILWRIGGLGGWVREDYKKRWGIFGSIGSAAPHINVDMRTVADAGMMLFERAGAKPFTVPSAPLKGWPEFASLPASYTGRNLRMLVDFFNRSSNLVINSFRATRFEWPLVEMKSLAESLARIEGGEEPLPPVEQVAQATEKKLPAYSAKDEWSDPAPPPALPSPRRDSDGLFYYCDPAGNRVFPTGFLSAERFISGPSAMAKVRLKTSDPDDWSYNYIDAAGNRILPFDSDNVRYAVDGIFEVSNKSRRGAINRSGLYDSVRRVFLLPWEFNWASLGQDEAGQPVFETRKIIAKGGPVYEKRYGAGLSKVQDVTSEHGVYRWDSANRTLNRVSFKTLTWQTEAGGFKGPLN